MYLTIKLLVMKDTAKPATPGQIIEIGNSLSGSVVKLLQERNLSFEQAKTLIEKVGKKKITEASNLIVEKLFELAPVDATLVYKKDLETFFLKV